jgi:hypothetical protein
MLSDNVLTSAHDWGQVLMCEGKSCSLRRAFTSTTARQQAEPSGSWERQPNNGQRLGTDALANRSASPVVTGGALTLIDAFHWFMLMLGVDCAMRLNTSYQNGKDSIYDKHSGD